MSRPRPRYRRTPQATEQAVQAPGDLPPVLPRVVVTVDERDRLTVVLDGAPVTGAPIGRHALGGVLDEILRARRVPVRVEVIEHDGATYTDLLTPQPPVPEPPSSQEPAPTEQSREETARHVAPVLVEVAGDGFVPGEDVAVAVIIRHTSAAHTGHARHLLEERELGGNGEVLLFGRISGTTTVIGGLS